jgi:DNA-binding NarL/FixJ family response regulator
MRMAARNTLERGREAYRRRQWRRAHADLAAADREAPLEAADLDRLATAAYLIGEERLAADAWTRAHRALIDAGSIAAAARCAFWLSLTPLLRGDAAQASGWLARAERLLEQEGTDCVEHGYLLVLRGLVMMKQESAEAACAVFQQGHVVSERFADADLKALSLLARGQALIERAQLSDGLTSLDEAMTAVTAGEISPILAGVVYCAVILTCRSIFDLRRAREWTEALSAWCADQPELVSFQGQCLVHRAEILQHKGDWPEATAVARRACARQAEQSETTGGRAFYRQGELHRLCGRFDLAEQAYREAGLRGCEPQPGLSQLRLAQDDVDAAAASIRRVIAEAGDRQGPARGTARSVVLGPYVEIMLAAGDIDAARSGAEDLSLLAGAFAAPVLRAAAAEAQGAVLLADDETTPALAVLREAWTAWQQQQAPYEAARVRVLIAMACRRLGDHDTADIHFDAARSVFERLGAGPDLERVERLRADAAGPARIESPLSARELEVLALVAAGRTNHEIAGRLGISAHTVARHLSNIFTKLGVGSRAAASAFALDAGWFDLPPSERADGSN